MTHFVALDDMDLTFPHGELFGRHFVHTDSMVGLTDELVAEALMKLNNPVDAACLPAPEVQEPMRW